MRPPPPLSSALCWTHWNWWTSGKYPLLRLGPMVFGAKSATISGPRGSSVRRKENSRSAKPGVGFEIHGKTIGPKDLKIAAICLSNGLTPSAVAFRSSVKLQDWLWKTGPALEGTAHLPSRTIRRPSRSGRLGSGADANQRLSDTCRPSTRAFADCPKPAGRMMYWMSGCTENSSLS